MRLFPQTNILFVAEYSLLCKFLLSLLYLWKMRLPDEVEQIETDSRMDFRYSTATLITAPHLKFLVFAM